MTTNNEQNGTKQSAIFPRACALGLAALLAVGCGAEADDDITSEALASDVPCGEGEEPTTDGGTKPAEPDASLRDPEGAYVAKISANGTGCPPGSWNSAISPDGRTFTMKFDAYEAAVDASSSVAIKDCQVGIKLHSPAGLSYRVKNTGFEGHAFLEQGVKARLVAGYYFQGNPVAAEQIRADLVGPTDDTFAFDDKVSAGETGVWSPCGVDRLLNVKTLVRVQNSEPKRSGKVTVENVLGLDLEWRKCDAGPAEPQPTEPEPGDTEEGEGVAPETDEPEASKPDAGVHKPRAPRGWRGGWRR